jgi:23S rRNA pseudouridine2457 synthase
VLVAFNKPYGVVSQFSPLDGHETLAAFGLPKGVYPCGRLDHDSEGLLLLSDDGALQHRLSDPAHKLEKIYWAQVERVPDAQAVALLEKGVRLKDGPTRPCKARLIGEPALPPRNPPIRFRKNVPTAWLELTLTEGRNRQVRRMTAAVGFPTLRLVRAAVGDYSLKGLAPGDWRKLK